MARTARALKTWNKKHSKDRKFREAVATEIIFQLDLAQEDRLLTTEERAFRASMKASILGLATLDRIDLSSMDEVITIDELKTVACDMHAEKAPGPDGFIGGFFKKCWLLIRHDLLAAINQIFALKGDHWHLLNSAHIVLIPKKETASSALEYRPISLMHSIAKLLGKLLSTRLAPELHHLVSSCQSAFIKKRSIHDNFWFVKSVLKDAQSKKGLCSSSSWTPQKLLTRSGGITLLRPSFFGFSPKWKNLISLILALASSKVLLNGIPGNAFTHKIGLR